MDWLRSGYDSFLLSKLINSPRDYLVYFFVDCNYRGVTSDDLLSSLFNEEVFEKPGLELELVL